MWGVKAARWRAWRGVKQGHARTHALARTHTRARTRTPHTDPPTCNCAKHDAMEGRRKGARHRSLPPPPLSPTTPFSLFPTAVVPRRPSFHLSVPPAVAPSSTLSAPFFCPSPYTPPASFTAFSYLVPSLHLSHSLPPFLVAGAATALAHTHARARMHAHACTRTHARTHSHTQPHTPTCTRARAHIHIHTHTQSGSKPPRRYIQRRVRARMRLRARASARKGRAPVRVRRSRARALRS